MALARALSATELAPEGLRGARRASLEGALDAYWAEMVPRGAAKVGKSRRAADLLHSPAALAVAHETTRAAAAEAERGDG